MASSLSSVPPVWPRPRPEIIGTKPPQAATAGASARLTASPTPPVECLSRTGPGRSQESTAPERVMARVRATRSSGDRPRKNTAMAKAAAWPSETRPSVRPETKASMSSADSVPPSRFARMISWGRCEAVIGVPGRPDVRSAPSPLPLHVGHHQRLRVVGFPGDGDQRRDGKKVGQHQEDLSRHPGADLVPEAELEGIEGAEQERAQKRLARPPGGEHGERDADPAASARHLEEEGVEGRHGEKGAPERHQGGAGDHGPEADAMHVESLRRHGGGIL